jgi:hypothetical protein
VTVPPWAGWWLFGAVLGITLLRVMIFSPIAFPLALAVLVVLVLRSPERASLGGGALIPTGLWFLYELRAAVERCAAMNGPNGSCEICGVQEQAIAMGLYVAVGMGPHRVCGHALAVRPLLADALLLLKTNHPPTINAEPGAISALPVPPTVEVEGSIPLCRVNVPIVT